MPAAAAAAAAAPPPLAAAAAAALFLMLLHLLLLLLLLQLLLWLLVDICSSRVQSARHLLLHVLQQMTAGNCTYLDENTFSMDVSDTLTQEMGWRSIRFELHATQMAVLGVRCKLLVAQVLRSLVSIPCRDTCGQAAIRCPGQRKTQMISTCTTTTLNSTAYVCAPHVHATTVAAGSPYVIALQVRDRGA